MTLQSLIEQCTPYFCLLDDTKSTRADACHLFFDPVSIVTCDEYSEIDSALAKLDRANEQGYYVAGWFSYEMGAHFHHKLPQTPSSENAMPLMVVGIFKQHARLSKHESLLLLQGLQNEEQPSIEQLSLSMTQNDYVGAIDTILKHIYEGDTYQINYTMKYHFDVRGCRLKLYELLRAQQTVHYGACLQLPGHHILSLSPELFIKKTNDMIMARPMKGTMKRGQTPLEDRQIQNQLFCCPKNRAENVMIVDLLRNDLGHLAIPGTLRVPELFTIEQYETLFQMTSSVQAQLPITTSLSTLLRHLFPCGSITGAPKLRTMQIIRELEQDPRGVYTGAIGYAMPNHDVCLNVPIRTLHITENGKAEMGIGSGIVADSDPVAEFDECLLKAKFFEAILTPS